MLKETGSGIDYFLDLRRQQEKSGLVIKTEGRIDHFKEMSKGKSRNRLKKTADEFKGIKTPVPPSKKVAVVDAIVKNKAVKHI